LPPFRRSAAAAGEPEPIAGASRANADFSEQARRRRPLHTGSASGVSVEIGKPQDQLAANRRDRQQADISGCRDDAVVRGIPPDRW
jgi:hypothetical protein